MSALAELATGHLLLRLAPLNRVLRAAAERRSSAAARLAHAELTTVCITPDHVNQLLDEVDAVIADQRALGAPSSSFTDTERATEANLRARAGELGLALPLDALARDLALDAFALECVVLCAAPELDSAYERIFAYVLDDLSRRTPCVELLVGLTAATATERLARRRVLSAYGTLRTEGVLAPAGEAASELRQELRLTRRALEHLLGTSDDVGWRARPVTPSTHGIESDARTRLESLGRALATGKIDCVGVWGGSPSEHRDSVATLAAAAGRELLFAEQPLGEALDHARFSGRLLWVPLGAGGTEAEERERDAGLERVATSSVPVCFTGARRSLPLSLLERRRYAEVELTPACFASRERLWAEALPELGAAGAADFAARFRLGAPEIRASAKVARTQASLATNGVVSPVARHVESACRLIARRSSDGAAELRTSARTAEELILPAHLHRQVLEVASFARAWPRVAENWGLSCPNGASGVKALFTGDPGTGKTLAAEVIASLVGTSLLRVDLSRVVSKWIGETEKNLERLFRTAEETSAVLLFDEADALFGKRAEVERGSDRYANLEVSYLLQRLEAFDGLAILTSNLRDHIDAAFTRRFQVALHFPRPDEPLRRRIWTRALPGPPAVGALDLAQLARLDMTGAAIVNSVRTAALLAASAGSERIEMAHLVLGIARQYRREARVLSPNELGVHRGLLAGEV